MEVYLDDNRLLTAGQTEMLTHVVLAAVEHVSALDASEVSISFVGGDEIRGLNRDYRGIDDVTDVLSFPVDTGLNIGAGRPLGDIVICMDVAQGQAQEYGHSIDRELAFLVVHGMLHLLGFDHGDANGEARMCRVQEEILLGLGIGRE